MTGAAGSDDATEEGSISVVPVIGATVEGPGVDTEFRPMPRTHEQAGRVRSMELEIRPASAQGWSILRTPLETCQSI